MVVCIVVIGEILLGSIETKDMNTRKIELKRKFEWKLMQVMPHEIFYIDTHLGDSNLRDVIDRVR